MRIMIKRMTVLACLAVLWCSAQVIAEPASAPYDSIAVIDAYNPDTGELVLADRRYQLAPDAVIHGLAAGDWLQPGHVVGYTAGSQKYAGVGVIKDLWVRYDYH